MRWKGRRGSSNIEDRRTQTGGVRRTPFGRGPRVGTGGRISRGRGIPVGRMSPRMALIVIGILVLAWLMGVDLGPLIGGGPTASVGAPGGPLTEAEKQAGQFVSVTLADTEEVWAGIFDSELGRHYTAPVLVLFPGETNSACGGANAATGPFYCPADRKVYLDTDFFTTLERSLGAGGDFAAAYVVAHEVGHHVENLLGVLGAANAARRGVSGSEANAISVRVELMADCLAGLWAQKAEAKFLSLDPGDIDEALNAAAKIGDDTLQRNAGRRPVPDSFTHGTSEQRSTWFRRGYEGRGVETCDTFGPGEL